MRNPKYPNDIGVGWKNEGESGKYISIALDLEMLMEMTGGAVDTVYVQLYPVKSEHPKAPDFQLKYYPKTAAAVAAPTPATSTRRDPIPDDDDIPF